MNIAIVGLGYWGPNLVRNFEKISEVEELYICDLRKDRLEKIHGMYPRTIPVSD